MTPKFGIGVDLWKVYSCVTFGCPSLRGTLFLGVGVESNHTKPQKLKGLGLKVLCPYISSNLSFGFFDSYQSYSKIQSQTTYVYIYI